MMKLGKDVVQISELNPAKYNPRKIQPKAFNKLKKSIEEFGMVQPIIVNKRTGMTVVGGHQRLKAAKELGMKEVPVQIVDMDRKREAALNIMLNNKKAQGEDDFTMLADLLSELDDGQFDMDLTGFEEEERERIATWTPNLKKNPDLKHLTEDSQAVKDVMAARRRGNARMGYAAEVNPWLCIVFQTYEQKMQFFDELGDKKIQVLYDKYIDGEVFAEAVGIKIDKCDQKPYNRIVEKRLKELAL